MKTTVERRTVDLSQYPDLVVIYLGMRVNRLAGLKTLLGFRPKIRDAVGAAPRRPPAARGPPVLPRAPPRRDAPVLAGLRVPGAVGAVGATGSGGSGSCATRAGRASGTRRTSCGGGMEAIYDDVPRPRGLGPVRAGGAGAGAMFGARRRLGVPGEAGLPGGAGGRPRRRPLTADGTGADTRHTSR